MKILVGYKRVVDYNVRIQVKPDGSGVVTDGVKLSANPFDDIALEEALRLHESGVADEVVIAGIGPANLGAHLRNGLGMGADRAIHVVSEEAVQPLTAARVFLKLIEKEQPGLVILGKQAIDDDNGQTGQMLAALWDRPQATFASKLEIADGKATVTREVGRPGSGRGRPARRGHHRPAPERAPFHQAHRHHEGQVQAARGHRAGQPRRRTRRPLEEHPLCAAAQARQGRDGEGCRRAGRRAETEGPAVSLPMPQP